MLQNLMIVAPYSSSGMLNDVLSFESLGFDFFVLFTIQRRLCGVLEC